MGTKVEFFAAPRYSRGMDPRDSDVLRTPSSRDQNLGREQSWARGGGGVTPAPSHRWGKWRGGILPWALLFAVTCLTPAPFPAQSVDLPAPAGSPRVRLKVTGDLPPELAKQRQTLMQENLDKSKTDAAELAALAKELRAELEKPNASILSPEVINRADKIEKLAKKIRDETKGYY